MENYYQTDNSDNQFNENKRSGFLTFLCILTFIISGNFLLSYFIISIFASQFLEILSNSAMVFSDDFFKIYEQMAAMPTWHFYLLSFFCAISIFGAIYMFKMKKIGFHIYAVSKIALIFTGLYIVGGYLKPAPINLIITLLFIGLYASYYKKFI